MRRLAVLLGLTVLAAGAAAAFATRGRPASPEVPVVLPRPSPGLRAALGPAPRRPLLAVRERRAMTRALRRHPVVVRGGGRRREVALTFDDGPGPYTPAVLGVLRARRAPATFFLVGEMIPFFRRAFDAERRGGFALGDHTVGHVPLTAYTAPAQRAQIAPVARWLRTRLFRPPYRLEDERTRRVARRLGLVTVLWDVEAGDWERPGAAEIVRRVLTRARPGSIVGMHDAGGDRSQTVAALPAIITGLRCRGLRLVTVPRLLADDPPPTGGRLRSPRAHRHRRGRGHRCGRRGARGARAARARGHRPRGARAGRGGRVGVGERGGGPGRRRAPG